MKPISAAIGLVWLCSAASGQRMWMERSTSSIVSNPAEITVQQPLTGSEVADRPGVEVEDSAEPRVDLFGNEVENAVADYRIDRGGAVYERHSPETAVPRLGCPTS
jgi:hypothetical protein